MVSCYWKKDNGIGLMGQWVSTCRANVRTLAQIPRTHAKLEVYL